MTDDPTDRDADPDPDDRAPTERAAGGPDRPESDPHPGDSPDDEDGDGVFRYLNVGFVTGDPGVSEDAIAGGDHELGGGAVLTTGDTTVIARTVARVVVPIIMLTSLSLLFQGHNLPGGGFIGGVLTATAFVLLFVVYGLDAVRDDVLDPLLEALPRGREAGSERGSGSGVYRLTFSIGLALAVASGLAPILFDLPFLTQAVYFVHGVPLFGELELASALAFDLGVYLVVVGGLLTILREVGGE